MEYGEVERLSPIIYETKQAELSMDPGERSIAKLTFQIPISYCLERFNSSSEKRPTNIKPCKHGGGFIDIDIMSLSLSLSIYIYIDRYIQK